jgi:hypothetical protein
MRSLLLAACAFVAFAATMTVESKDANAVVCARGVYRAGCAGYRGAVVVHPPVAGPVVVAPAVRRPARTCRVVWANGVRVRRCYY